MSVTMPAGSSSCFGASSSGLLNSTESLKAMSKWKLLRNIFNCTRILWRFLGREAKNLRVHLTIGKRLSFVDNPVFAGSTPSSGHDDALSGRAGPKSKRRTDRLERPADCEELPVSYFDACRSAKTHVSQNSTCPEGYLCKQISEVFSLQQSSGKIVTYNVVLWSLVCDQHYTYHVHWGDWKLPTTSLSGSQSQNNVTYVSIVLFQAASIVLFRSAYFWLKFRESTSYCSREPRKRKLNQVQDEVSDHLFASKDGVKGIYRRAKKHKDGTISYIYEPRFKPPRERQPHNGASQQLGWIYVGQFDSPEEAQIAYNIIAFYYDKPANGGRLELGSTSLEIPPMSEQDCRLCDEDKRKWVKSKTKEVFEDFRKAKASKVVNQANRILGSKFGEPNVEAADLNDDSLSIFGASQISVDANSLHPPLYQIANPLPEDLIVDPKFSPSLHRETVLHPLHSSDSQMKQFPTAGPVSVPDVYWASILQQLDSADNHTKDFEIENLLENHGQQPFERATLGSQLLRPMLTDIQVAPLGSILSHAGSDGRFSFHQYDLQEDPLHLRVNCLQQLISCQNQRLKDFALQKESLRQRVEDFAIQIKSQQQQQRESIALVLHLQRRLGEADALNQKLRCENEHLRNGGAAINSACVHGISPPCYVPGCCLNSERDDSRNH